MEAIASVGARTTPLDPRFALRGPGGVPGRAPATRMLMPTVVRRAVPRANVAPGAGIAAFTEAISEFEAGGVAVDAAAPVDMGAPPVDPEFLARTRDTILPDGTILPAGMSMGHRAMRVKFLKRTLKLAISHRERLKSKYELMGRWLVGLKMALAGARDSLRIAYLNHADPGRIQYLTNKVKTLEAQVGKVERDMHDVFVEVGVLNTQINEMTAELMTYGESV